MSDLLFVGCHPYLADGDPIQLLKALMSLSQLNATCFVPVHGPIGTSTISIMLRMLEHCLDTAHRLVEEGYRYRG